jgi:hypothetical protein
MVQSMNWTYCDVFTPWRNRGDTEVSKHGDYATINNGVFSPCRSEPQDVEDRPCRAPLHHAHFQGNAVANTVTTHQYCWLRRFCRGPCQGYLYNASYKITLSVFEVSKWMPDAPKGSTVEPGLQKNTRGLPVEMYCVNWMLYMWDGTTILEV